MFGNGSLIVVGVFIIGFIGLGLGLRSRGGSEMDEHPSDGTAHESESAAPQSKGGGGIAQPTDEGGTDPFDSHGTG